MLPIHGRCFHCSIISAVKGVHSDECGDIRAIAARVHFVVRCSRHCCSRELRGVVASSRRTDKAGADLAVANQITARSTAVRPDTLFLAIVIIKDKLPEAHRRAQAERNAWNEQERKKAAAAAVALSQRRETARAKAVAIARADYPQHIDEEALAERGWRGEEDNFDIIGRYLDPPEVVLKYTVLGDDDEMALRLYDRERAESVQAIDPEVIDHIRTVLRTREHAAAAKLREEEEARLEAEEAAAEEEEKSEAQRRLAQQKIIRIDDRLK